MALPFLCRVITFSAFNRVLIPAINDRFLRPQIIWDIVFQKGQIHLIGFAFLTLVWTWAITLELELTVWGT